MGNEFKDINAHHQLDRIPVITHFKGKPNRTDAVTNPQALWTNNFQDWIVFSVDLQILFRKNKLKL